MNWRAEINARRFFPTKYSRQRSPADQFLFLEITGGIKWGKKGYSYRKKVNQEAVRNE